MTDGFRPVGEALPPRRDSQTIEARDAPPARLEGRSESIVVPEARDRMLEFFERDWVPTETKNAMGTAIFGDLRAQQQLFQAMIDTWPRLQKALREIKLAVRKAPWKAVPWSERGEDPEEPAEKLATEIEGVMWSMRPDQARQLRGFEGMLEALAEGYYIGHQVIEPHWQRGADGVWSPVSAKVLPSRFFRYPAVEDDEDRLMLDRTGGLGMDHVLEDFPEHRFLIGVNSSHTGHPAVGAPLRALTPYWMAAVYGLRWAMTFSQLFGIPFRWANYADEGDKKAVSEMLQNIGTAGWAAFKGDTKLNLIEPKQGGQNLPQWKLIEMADEQCDVFMLGQTLTTSQGESGARSLGEVHEGIRHQVISGVCDFVGEILTHQLVPAYAAFNYGGERHDLPGIWARFEESKNELEMAQRDAALGITSGRTPVPRSWFYDRHGLQMPADDDEIFQPAGPDGARGEPATGRWEEGSPHETEARRLESIEAADATRFADSLGVPRSEMPQIDGRSRGAMMRFLRARGASVEREEADPEFLYPVQLTFDPDKVRAMREAMRSGRWTPRRILVSDDNRVLDGHHQYRAALEERPAEMIPVFRVGLPADRALMMLHRMPSTRVEAADTPAGGDPQELYDEMAKALRDGRLLDWQKFATMLEAATLDGAGDEETE